MHISPVLIAGTPRQHHSLMQCIVRASLKHSLTAIVGDYRSFRCCCATAV